MDAITNKLAGALQDLYLECRAQGLPTTKPEMAVAFNALAEYRIEAGKEILAATDAKRDMADEPQELEDLLVLVVGDPANGYRFIGPFNDMEDASSYALSEDSAWSICDLDKPEER